MVGSPTGEAQGYPSPPLPYAHIPDRTEGHGLINVCRGKEHRFLTWFKLKLTDVTGYVHT